MLSGTPTAAGTASFTVNVTDTAGATLSQNYTLTVNTGVKIAPAALAEATAGTATSQTITVSGGTKPYTTFSVLGSSPAHRADAREPDHKSSGGDGDALRHAECGGHGDLHGQRHRHGGRDPHARPTR